MADKKPRAGDTFIDAAGGAWTIRACSDHHVAVARPEDPEAILMSTEEWEAVQESLAETERERNCEG